MPIEAPTQRTAEAGKGVTSARKQTNNILPLHRHSRPTWQSDW